MDIDRVVRQCFLEYGYSEGVFPLTKLEYSMLASRTRKSYDMSPEEYLAGKGMNIKFDIL